MNRQFRVDVLAHNKLAWNHQVDDGNPWTVPVSPETVEKARQGELQLLLTPTLPVPADWYPPLSGTPVLCLASGGGQQAPLLAAAGARVTVLDNSPGQLAQDRLVARRENLPLETVEGNAADLSTFNDESFGLVFHPCSNCFMENVRVIWRECARVLRPGGILLAGFNNPVRYIFDDERMEKGILEVRHSIPYSDLHDLDAETLKRRFVDNRRPLEFGHSLDDQIGGQLAAGLVLTGFYEDRYSDLAADELSRYLPTFIATRAIKAGPPTQ